MILVYKKGDRYSCYNYIGITAKYSYKVVSKILFKCLEPLGDKSIGEYQDEFRKQKSTSN